MDTITTIEARRSNRHYDPTRNVHRSTIEELIRLASLAPSSFNMQHWKMVVVSDPERKKLLHKLAMNQPQVLDAAATLIVVGDPTAYQDAEIHFQEWVRSGVIDETRKEKYVKWAFEMYDPPTSQMARDEAIRSASLWAMAFMLAAKTKGLATGPMIGFDPAGVQQQFHIPAPLFPVMLLTLGYAAGEPKPRLARKPANQIAHWNDW